MTYQNNRYKIYAFRHKGRLYIKNWEYMKLVSTEKIGKVDWKWINQYKYDTLCSNQNPYCTNGEFLWRTLYGRRVFQDITGINEVREK